MKGFSRSYKLYISMYWVTGLQQSGSAMSHVGVYLGAADFWQPREVWCLGLPKMASYAHMKKTENQMETGNPKSGRWDALRGGWGGSLWGRSSQAYLWYVVPPQIEAMIGVIQGFHFKGLLQMHCMEVSQAFSGNPVVRIMSFLPLGPKPKALWHAGAQAS